MLQSVRRRPWWPEVIVLLAVSITAAWVVNVGRPEPLPWWADYKAKKVEETVRKGLEVVAPADARALLTAGTHLFVDARTPDEFAAGHIPGAVNIPSEALLTGIDDAVQGLKPDALIVVYCGNLACPKSKEVAEGLKGMGFTKLSVMPEGLEGWRAVGGPVEGN